MDEGYMKRVLELARKGIGRTSPNPLVGAVIVKDGRILGEGWHEAFGLAHAEVNAVRAAEAALGRAEAKGGGLAGATVYVNLEPCCHHGKTPPCTELLIKSNIGRVVIGTLDPNPLVAGKGAAQLRKAGIAVETGVLERESRKLNEVFFHYIRTNQPFVVLKGAMSLDGKIAAASGEAKWITGEEAREDVHRLRAQYTSIMTGVETVIRDDPELTCRLKGGRNPKRIILDSSLRVPVSSRLLMDPESNPVLLACTERASPESARRLTSLGAEILYCKSRDGRVDLSDLIEKLGTRSIDSVLLEGGSSVNASAFFQGIVDKAVFYLAPKIIGGETTKSVVGGLGAEFLSQAYPLFIEDVCRVGEDLKITGYRKDTFIGEEKHVYRDC